MRLWTANMISQVSDAFTVHDNYLQKYNKVTRMEQ